MIQAFRFIEISKYGDGGQLTTRGQLMQGSSTVVDDRKVDHLRETYKERLFSLNKNKINLKILSYIEKYDCIKQMN